MKGLLSADYTLAGVFDKMNFTTLAERGDARGMLPHHLKLRQHANRPQQVFEGLLGRSGTSQFFGCG